MSICFMCKHYNREVVNDLCNANVAKRHKFLKWLMGLFGLNYLQIFTSKFLYPCDIECNCFYYKRKK